MKQFTMRLNKANQRPIAILKEWYRFSAMIYPGLHIIAHRMNLPCQMIVSATMLQDMIYEIDDRNHRMNVTIPDGQSNVRNVRIRKTDGLLKVLCSSGE